MTACNLEKKRKSVIRESHCAQGFWAMVFCFLNPSFVFVCLASSVLGGLYSCSLLLSPCPTFILQSLLHPLQIWYPGLIALFICDVLAPSYLTCHWFCSCVSSFTSSAAKLMPYCGDCELRLHLSECLQKVLSWNLNSLLFSVLLCIKFVFYLPGIDLLISASLFDHLSLLNARPVCCVLGWGVNSCMITVYIMLCFYWVIIIIIWWFRKWIL